MSTILVVNDDPLQLHFVATLLEQDGLEVLRAQSAESALRLLGDRKGVDALVVDLHMPGIDGWGFCRLLRSPEYDAFNDLPILIMSTVFSGREAEQITADVGANGFLAMPADPAELRSHVRQMLLGHASKSALRALIIDGSESSVDLLSRTLGGHGWVTHIARSGKEGLGLLQELDPDIVILDHRLPDMNGMDLLAEIKRPGASSVVMVTTNDSNPHIALEAIRRGADGYVRKPFDPEYLLAVCIKTRRERSLLRVEEVLEQQTRSLQATEAQFRGLVEGLTDIVFVRDDSDIIRHINWNGAHLLGWTPAELIGQPVGIIDVRSPQGNPSHHHHGDIFRPREKTFFAKDGQPVFVNVREQPIMYHGTPGMLVVARDIRERQHVDEERVQLEEQLQQAQKMEAIGRVAAGVAHDVNNILTAILGHASVLAKQVGSSTPPQQASTVIEQAARRGQQLTAQLLGLARQGNQQTVPVNLHDTIQEVLTLIGRVGPHPIEVQPELHADRCWVQGDPGQLHQVILNLALNACDAMPHGGRIQVETKNVVCEREASQKDPGLIPGHYLVVSVQDTGCGMSADVQKRIFEPFFTTKEPGKGSGMGLAMVDGMVKNHGGSIAVESETGRGTTLHVFLPCVHSVVLPKGDNPGASLSGKKHILVVDDEDLVAQTAGEILQYLGYHPVVMTRAREGVEYYREHWSQIDLVLLDMMMVDMDGRACFRALQSINPNVQVVLCTGIAYERVLQEWEETGIAGFVQKPYGLKELSQVVSDALGGHHGPQECHALPHNASAL